MPHTIQIQRYTTTVEKSSKHLKKTTTTSNKVEIEFLRKKDIGSDPNDWTWTTKAIKDIYIVSTLFVLYGPCQPTVVKKINISRCYSKCFPKYS